MQVHPIEPGALVGLITHLLEKHGHPRPGDWARDLHEHTLTSNNPNIQRFHINRVWRAIIGKVNNENTMDIRLCLDDSGDVETWLRHFESKVIPCIMRNNLPPVRV